MSKSEDRILSPLTGSEKVIFKESILTADLIHQYKEVLDIDVSYLFSGLKEIRLYECLETGYKFFFPHHISGDDTFYKNLSKSSWYYLPWKWEHEECSKIIKNESKILEVGAARGDFLYRLQQDKNVYGTGLELGSEVVEDGKQKGVNLINETIEQHALNNKESYDVVCSFQVLEHIAHVGSAIEAMVTCLKRGGLLIISVPNNDSFIKDNPLPSRVLNMPPHHMGLWNAFSLKSISHFFSVEHINTIIEPLQSIHSDTYQYTKIKQLLFNSHLLVRIYWKLRIHRMVRPILQLFSKRIMGHSIIAVYKKY